MLSLYVSFDAEFNADSEYVHGLGYLLNIKGVSGQKTCLWDIFFGFFSFFGRTKQVAVKMKTDSELALKNEYDSEKKRGKD